MIQSSLPGPTGLFGPKLGAVVVSSGGSRDKLNSGVLTKYRAGHSSPHTLMGQSSTLDTQTSVLEDFRFDAREERFFCESICFVNSICKILNQFQVEIKYNLLNEAPLFNSEESQFKQNSQTKCEL